MLLTLESQICIVIVLQKEFNRTMTWRRSTELPCLCVKPVWGTKSQYLNEIQSKTDKTWTWCCIIVSSHICWINFEPDKASFLEDNNKCFTNFIQKKKITYLTPVGLVWANWNIYNGGLSRFDCSQGFHYFSKGLIMLMWEVIVCFVDIGGPSLFKHSFHTQFTENYFIYAHNNLKTRS
jgi:hypothetical protein